MPKLQWGLSSYQRARGDLPGLPVVNMFAEEAPTEERQMALQSRSGLVDREADMGGGPVKALFKRDGVLDNALFGVSALSLYRDETLLGAIDGDGPASLAGYENFLFTAAGARLWGWDGTTFAAIAFPDSADVSKVIVGASRAICIRKDTGQFYWSDVLETDIEALDFATAENQPDRLLDCLFVDDILILFGAETVEFWPNTSDAQLPFQPLEGRVIEKGIRGTGCAATFGSSFAWVTNENNICIGDERTIVSNPGLQARIEAATEVSLFTFTLDGTEFLALRLAFADETGETHAYCARSGMFSEFESYGQANWIPQCFSSGVFGSALDGRTLAWSTGHEDLGGVLERRFRAGFAINAGGIQISSVQVRGNVGQTPYLTGDYTNPLVEMRLSRDAGQTWGNWKQTALGAQGEYRRKAQWRACGLASQPGFLAEFRVTAPIDWRVSDVLVNEGAGGR